MAGRAQEGAIGRKLSPNCLLEGCMQGLGAAGGSSGEDSTRPHPLVVAPFPP